MRNIHLQIRLEGAPDLLLQILLRLLVNVDIQNLLSQNCSTVKGRLLKRKYG